MDFFTNIGAIEKAAAEASLKYTPVCRNAVFRFESFILFFENTTNKRPKTVMQIPIQEIIDNFSSKSKNPKIAEKIKDNFLKARETTKFL